MQFEKFAALCIEDNNIQNLIIKSSSNIHFTQTLNVDLDQLHGVLQKFIQPFADEDTVKHTKSSSGPQAQKMSDS